MACFRCPRCGRLHLLASVDDEEGGRCACGARFWVVGREDEPEPVGGLSEETGVTTWTVGDDGTPNIVVVY